MYRKKFFEVKIIEKLLEIVNAIKKVERYGLHISLPNSPA